MVGKKTGVKGVQSNQSPPKGKATFNVSKRVQDLQAREEVEREEAESHKRKARDTDSELDTSGEAPPPRKMGEVEKIAEKAARKVKADMENAVDKSIKAGMDRMFERFVEKLDGVETGVKNRLDQVETRVTATNTALTTMSGELNSVSQKVGLLSSEMARMDTRVDRHEDKLDAMSKKHEDFQRKMEDQLAQLQDRVENGSFRGNANPRGPLTRAELHEQTLLNIIEESKKNVIIVNTKKSPLNPREMAKLLVDEDLIPKDEKDTVKSTYRLGNPQSSSIVYKVTMSTTAAAQQLLERSRTDRRLQTGGPRDYVKAFPHMPNEYADREREYRDLKPILYDKGYVTRTVFNNTQIQLQMRYRGSSDAWVAVPGSSYTPPVPGEEEETAEDTDHVKMMREVILKDIWGGEDAIDKTLLLLTPNELTPDEARARIAQNPEPIRVVQEERKQGPRSIWAFVYQSREQVETAIKRTEGEAGAPSRLKEGEMVRMRCAWGITHKKHTTSVARVATSQQQTN